MKAKTLAYNFLPFLFICFFTIPAWGGPQTDFNEAVVFGTSLSDSGNFFVETKEVNVPPEYDLDPAGVPNSPYAIGGHHMTNGPTWIEQLAKTLGIGPSVQPASRSQNPKAMNYATDGTRAAASPFHNRTILADQVDDFLNKIAPGPAPADALYVIEVGSNDVRDAIFALLFLNDFTLAVQIVEEAIAALDEQVKRLRGAGAQQFLYVNVPPVLDTPALNTLPIPDPVKALIDIFIVGKFNDELRTIVFAGLDATEFDFFGLASEVVVDPGAFGLMNVTEACITPFEPPFKCQHPDDYLFWDVVHPTKAGHGIMAEGAAEDLEIN